MATNYNYVTATGHKPYVRENEQFLEHRVLSAADPNFKSIWSPSQKQAKICGYYSPKALNSTVIYMSI